MTTQILIVGAGPAGASAAIGLAQRGVRDVLLLDRTTFPRDKTCGSGLSPNALEMGERLGVGEDLKRLSTPIMSVKLVTSGGRSMVLASNAEAVVLLRRDFDNLLLERARSLGVSFEGDVHVTLVKDGERVVGVRTADGRAIDARYVLLATGAHSPFSQDPRPKKSIGTLMGWWEGMEFVPEQIEMVFDRNVAPLYGWLFPETDTRVNIGICIDGQDSDGHKTRRNVREVFARFLKDHYADRMKSARQIGKLKGHPIVHTTWIGHLTAPGALYLGEAARLTHNATGEGISQAMQSGLFAAETLAAVLAGHATEDAAWTDYTSRTRKRFTPGFVAGHALRAVMNSRILDGVAMTFNQPFIRRSVVRLLGSALAGSSVSESSGSQR